MRWTFYVDMDAYYVACELRDRPELVGRPVLVGPDPKLGPTRGVVLSASYEARRFGVRSAMPVRRAAELCPDAVWIPADFEKYEAIAREVRELLARDGREVVPLSIDEAAVRGEASDAASARRAAEDLQARVRDELRLPCSVGVAMHRTIAKIASDRAKPAGVVVVPPGDEPGFLGPLSIRVVPGVGPKTEEQLSAIGVVTVGDLLRVRRRDLQRAVGGFAEELRRLASGAPTEEADRAGPVTRSAATTFSSDVRDREALESRLRALVVRLSETLVTEGLRFRSVQVTVRWSNFEQTQHGRRLPWPTQESASLEEAATRLFRELWNREQSGRHRAARTVSVAVGSLSREPSERRSLETFGEVPGRAVKSPPPPPGQDPP